MSAQINLLIYPNIYASFELHPFAMFSCGKEIFLSNLLSLLYCFALTEMFLKLLLDFFVVVLYMDPKLAIAMCLITNLRFSFFVKTLSKKFVTHSDTKGVDTKKVRSSLLNDILIAFLPSFIAPSKIVLHFLWHQPKPNHKFGIQYLEILLN
jgi:hypothetical protein